MLSEIDIRDVLFLDIETVPCQRSFREMSERMRSLWEKKSMYFRKEDETCEDVYNRAGIYAEFGKIICISAGIVDKINPGLSLRIKSYFHAEEKELLAGFSSMLKKYSANKTLYLCAHNGKEFDFPYLSRRMLVHGLKLPAILDNAGKKPWEIHHLDTMELWKFGDFKHYTSLELLTCIFNIPSPKNDMDGSMVAEIYWKDNNLTRIVEYCQNDVQAVVQLFLRYKGMDLISQENIEIVAD
jgi:predicted PolB exonuclease-like 3'-5' exonuclease